MSSRRLSDTRDTSRPVSSPAKKSAKHAADRKPQAVIVATATPAVTADERRGMIACAAYLRAEGRAFAAGNETEDWLEAEREIDALLGGGHSAAQ